MAVKGLEQLESLGRDLTMELNKSMLQTVADLSTKLTDALRDSISLKQSQFATGTLAQTVSALPIKETGSGLVLQIEWEDYGDYVDAGVSGTEVKRNTPYSYRDKHPPANVFQNYANNKGISPFAVAKSIFKKGFEGNKWATDIIEGNELDSLLDALADVLVDNVNINIVR